MNGNTEYQSDDDWGDSGPHSYSRTGNTQNAKEWRYLIYGGGLGEIYATELGWQIWIIVLIVSLCGSGIGLVIANRTILWSIYLENNYTAHTRLLYLISGTSDFSYPITTMYIQLVLVHLWVLLSAQATRWMSPLLQSAGLPELIAPKEGGIARGGLFEFDYSTARLFLPLVAVFAADKILSTISSTYTQYPIYVLARLGVVPCVRFIACRTGDNHNWLDVFFIMVATCSLGSSIYHPNIQYPLTPIVIGIFASLFAASYPVQVHKIWLSLNVPRVPELLNNTHTSETELLGNTAAESKARSIWLMFHYISLLSVILSTPIAILSGELPSFLHNVQTLDGTFYWLPVFCGSLASWAVFIATVSLTIQTNPVSVVLLFILEASIVHAMTIGNRLPVKSWVALSLCWVSCVLYLLRRWTQRRQAVRLHQMIERKNGLPL